jgi:hypothetical protein
MAYFSAHGRMTDPGALASLFTNLPVTIAGLVKLVQGLTIHGRWLERYGLRLPPGRMDELQLRSIERRLARTLELDPRPLTEPRPPQDRLVGNCRDFSLLLVSILRHQGVPARARCGFACYFLPGRFEDHWVAEYWDRKSSRWILVDAQLDSLQRELLNIGFDPLDVPRDQFISGGRAWQMCRFEGRDPGTFGIFDMHGMGFVRGNLVRDLASLNKMELLPWDCWGVILKRRIDNPQDLDLLDRAAALTCADIPDPGAVRTLYEGDSSLKVGGNLLSFVDGRAIEVKFD